MSSLLKIVIIIKCVTHCLSSKSLDCIDIQDSNQIFGTYVKRSSKGDRMYILYNKIGRQWALNLTFNSIDIFAEIRGEDSENFANVSKIFGTFFKIDGSSQSGVSFNCILLKGNDQIYCDFEYKTTKKRLNNTFDANYSNPIFLSPFPSDQSLWSGSQVLVYNSEDKSDFRRVRLAKKVKENNEFTLEILPPDTTNISFINAKEA